MPAGVRPVRSRSKSVPAPSRGAVMSTTRSPSTTPTRVPCRGTANWQSFIARLPALRQAEPAPKDLVARLLVEDLPFGAALGHRAGVAAQDLAHLGVDRLLDPGLVGEDPDRLRPDVVGALERRDPFLLEEMLGEASGDVEDALAAPLHRTNPRSRASFSLVRVKSCR